MPTWSCSFLILSKDTSTKPLAFSVEAAKLWNGLPSEMKMLHSLNICNRGVEEQRYCSKLIHLPVLFLRMSPLYFYFTLVLVFFYFNFFVVCKSAFHYCAFGACAWLYVAMLFFMSVPNK